MEDLQIAVPMAPFDIVTVLSLLVHGDVLVDVEVDFRVGRVDVGRGAFEQTKILDPVVRLRQEGVLVPGRMDGLGDHELQIFLEVAFQLLFYTFCSFRTT